MTSTKAWCSEIAKNTGGQTYSSWQGFHAQPGGASWPPRVYAALIGTAPPEAKPARAISVSCPEGAAVYLPRVAQNLQLYHRPGLPILRLVVSGAGRRCVHRAPALAAGITDHGWSVRARLLSHGPPPRWTPPKQRGCPSHALTRLLEQ